MFTRDSKSSGPNHFKVAWTFNGGKATSEWVSTARNQDVMQTMGPSWEFSFPSLDISTSGVRYQYVAKPSSKKNPECPS